MLYQVLPSATYFLAAIQKVGKKITAVVKWLKLSPYTLNEANYARLKRNILPLS